MKQRISVAIDGPAGAGKSSISKCVAKQLDYLYIDTGAMYRGVTWAVLDAGIDPEDEAAVTAMLPTLHLVLTPAEDGCRVRVHDKDITEEIRSQAVNQSVSQIASYKSVREYLVAQQRALAAVGGVILDGRDIGSVVLPNAELKVYLTASVEARAKRRWLEMNEREQISLEEIQQSVAQRDHMDCNRKESPLVCVPEAVVIDSSELSFEDTVVTLLRHIQEAEEREACHG